MNRLKELFFAPVTPAARTHGALMVILGGYLVYMAWQMVQNTLKGISEMSMTTTVILAAVMALAGLAVVAYGGILLHRAWLEEKKALPAEDSAAEDDGTSDNTK